MHLPFTRQSQTLFRLQLVRADQSCPILAFESRLPSMGSCSDSCIGAWGPCRCCEDLPFNHLPYAAFSASARINILFNLEARILHFSPRTQCLASGGRSKFRYEKAPHLILPAGQRLVFTLPATAARNGELGDVDPSRRAGKLAWQYFADVVQAIGNLLYSTARWP